MRKPYAFEDITITLPAVEWGFVEKALAAERKRQGRWWRRNAKNQERYARLHVMLCRMIWESDQRPSAG